MFEIYSVLTILVIVAVAVGVIFYVASSFTQPTPVVSITVSVERCSKSGGYWHTIVRIYNSGNIAIRVAGLEAYDTNGSRINIQKADYVSDIAPGKSGGVVLWTSDRPRWVSVTICAENYCTIKTAEVS